ncbi:hypothetical protein Sme01_29890 [Sphaerisporangium melleum]|uniref:Uncharacterized protein n=1 Tax=Sphaerisporangium melleum TaxID=321316 RepID=A0A917R1W9_9ACTN|nr:hypothetical protein [Sphaerisporangium melleum]GGK85222.1 hypothetical protein GCM10007964_29670 [Sphaerisporangium melleum]GII70513.1 hypothetical protein Sme01_29890 [Sphaerisporangium melleum]
MGLFEAGAWGVAGGLAAGLLTLMVAVSESNFRWPWDREQAWGQLFVIGCGLILGALVAGAAHRDMSGAWPAFIMGLGAPSIVRGLLSRVEVVERKDDKSTGVAQSAETPAEITPGGDGSGEVAI